jgi:hypothetical protein
MYTLMRRYRATAARASGGVLVQYRAPAQTAIARPKSASVPRSAEVRHLGLLAQAAHPISAPSTKEEVRWVRAAHARPVAEIQPRAVST